MVVGLTLFPGQQPFHMSGNSQECKLSNSSTELLNQILQKWICRSQHLWCPPHAHKKQLKYENPTAVGRLESNAEGFWEKNNQRVSLESPVMYCVEPLHTALSTVSEFILILNNRKECKVLCFMYWVTKALFKFL